MSGPLQGLSVLELGGIGPVPHAGMMLADMGAEVISVCRVGAGPGLAGGVLARGKRSLSVDIRTEAGQTIILDLSERVDVLIEGFRPGVCERLGLGPDACHQRNPGLVYGRMTGWGQHGPLAARAGHDIDYIAVSGALAAIGPQGRPFPPLNLLGDFGGGSMLLVVGVLSALWSGDDRKVVDAAMVDGSAQLMAMQYGAMAEGWWSGVRGEDLFDGSAPFYTTYETADGRWVAVGALEPQFYSELLVRTGLDSTELPAQMDRSGWPIVRQRLAEVFITKTRAEWETVFADSDACVVGVYSMTEAPDHPHNREREMFIEVGGVIQPAPAPRFSTGPRKTPSPAPQAGADTHPILAELGRTPNEIKALTADGVVGPNGL